MERRGILFFAAILSLPGPLYALQDEQLARLPENYRQWLEQEVPYIISDRERNAFLDFKSVEEWEAFIAAFWRRRDPDPLTPVNEFREEHYRRIEHANKEFGRESPVPGWMTDRGKMYIILGDPDDRDHMPAAPGLYPVDVWFYQADRERSLPPLFLLFFQEHNAGPYRLFNHVLDAPEDLMPAQPLDPESRRFSAYEFLQRISPDLAHATLTMRADEGVTANLQQPERAGLDVQMILSDIEQAPFRRVDTSYVDAAKNARGLVESDYLFNYVPNSADAHVLPGPGGTRFVHYAIEIEPQHMTLARDEEKNVYYTRFELQGEVTTIDGERVVLQFLKEPYMALTETQFREVQYKPFSYRDMFPIAGGEFRFRVVLKNQARTEYTIFETELRVPEHTEAPRIGPPVLLYGTRDAGEPEMKNAYRTYQIGSLRLDPNARRTYVLGETVEAHVPLENATPENQVALRILHRDDLSASREIAKISAGPLSGAPLVATMPLSGVEAGRYRLVADLIGPGGEVLESAHADFEVSPRTNLLRPWILRESINGEELHLTRTALADQYMKLGDMGKARELYQQALNEEPGLVTPRVVLARLYLDESDPAKAVDILEPAASAIGRNAEALLTLADAYSQAANYPRAVELYEAALILRPPDTALLNALGLCHARLGNKAKALDYFERSLALNPNQEEVQKAVGELKAPASPSRLKS
jgi:GWxTD domain-containing protein